MRKFFLSISAVFTALFVQAQVEKKDVLFGGNLGVYFNQTGPNNYSSNSNIQPFVQFAYKNNRTVGFAFDVSYLSQKSNNGNNESQQFSFGPAINFTQYHPIKGAFGWWLQEELGARFSSSKNVSSGNEQTTDATTVALNVTPGLYFTIGEKKNWLLQASVGGIGGSYSGSNGVDSWGFGTSLFQYYRFGFAYIFRK
jgi:hypothetical protein